jgi:pimeloyl-ACP methyl ester carboxylesterase
MPRFQSTFDGAELFYRDYIPASTPKPYNPKVHDVNESQPALLFLHQWPLTSEMWDPLMVQLSETYRFRCIAPDRRGFGRSDWNGVQLKCTDIDYNVFAKDVVDLLEKLQIGKFVFIAASMGGGESLLAYQSSDYIRQHCQVCPSHRFITGRFLLTLMTILKGFHMD